MPFERIDPSRVTVSAEHPPYPGLEGLAGKPRWWTVSVDGEVRELVRVDYTDRDEQALCYVLIPKGVYQYPPLLAATFKLGEVGLDQLASQGATFFPYQTEIGRHLELLLVGMKR